MPDVNLIVYAHNPVVPLHPLARDWWTAVLNGPTVVAVPLAVQLAFIRLTTSSRVLEDPLSADEALSIVESWLSLRHVKVLQPTERHFTLLAQLLRQIGTAGNLTTDAHLAALVIEHDCEICSADRDFARFPGLTWRNPLEA